MYTRFCAALSRLSLILASIGLIAVILCVQWQVFGRYVMNDTPTWAEALAMLLVLFVTAFGLAVGVRDAGHIGLESLLVLAPDNVRRKMELLIHALVGVFGVVMAWQCAVLALSVAGYKIPTLGLSEAFKYAPPAIAGALVAMFSLEHILAILSGVEVEPAWH